MLLNEKESLKYAMLPNSMPRSVENNISKIKNFEGSNENKRFILGYDRQCSANGNKLSTRNTSLVVLLHLQRFAKDRSFKKFTREDIIRFFEFEKHRKFEDTRFKRKHGKPALDVLTESTVNLRRHLIRKFFAYVHGYETRGYPPVVDWMKVKRIGRDRKHKINPSDLLTPEEIYTIISCTESPRDRALVSLIAESGIRVGEASVLRIKDLKHTEYGLEIDVNGKTGPRSIPLVVCKPDLQIWLNNFHMFAADPKAPLFPRFNKKQLELNLHVDGIGNVIKKAFARAKLIRKSLQTKKVTPHSFRHARATELAALGWTEAMLRAYFGWTDDSIMPGVYIHLSQSDVAKRYYRMYGRLEGEEDKPKMLQENKSCPHCGIRNPTGYITCFSCDKPIRGEAYRRMENKQRIKATLNFIAKDSELAKKFSVLLQEADKKEKETHLAPTFGSSQERRIFGGFSRVGILSNSKAAE